MKYFLCTVVAISLIFGFYLGKTFDGKGKHEKNEVTNKIIVSEAKPEKKKNNDLSCLVHWLDDWKWMR